GGSVVTSPPGAAASTVIDGFTIRNGSAGNGAGVDCGTSAPVIGGNKLTGNVATSRGGAGSLSYSAARIVSNVLSDNSASSGGGVYCEYSSPAIGSNTISANTATSSGGGIYSYYGYPTISNNQIVDNTATSNGGGIYCYYGSPVITNNVLVGNSAGSYGGGVYVYSSSPWTVANNVVGGNSADYGGGVYCYGPGLLANNTITDNFAPEYSVYVGGGVYLSYSSANVVNNIIAFNTSGLYRYGSTTPTLSHNCVYGNTVSDYSGITDPTGSDGNIKIDPQLVSVSGSNAHILPASPCRDAGDNAVVTPGWLDMDGQARIQPVGGVVDIGVDESDGSEPPVTNKTIHVRSDGDDANDGSSWQLAKQTVAAGLAAATYGDQVWVAGGLYAERITLKKAVALYGGFPAAGGPWESRSPLANETILDGGAGGSVVTSPPGAAASTVIDGFTIRNGSAGNGAGVYCGTSSPVISGNKLTGNVATSKGGAVYLYYSAARIVSNVLSGNSASSGGGVYCEYSSPAIGSNTISGNVATGNGGGVYCYYGSPVFANNAVCFNTRGIYRSGGSPTLNNNCVYGNSVYDYQGVSAGAGDISADPLFANRTGGDYHLTSVSPCVDAGTNTARCLPSFDMDGDPRIQGGVVDIGADEFSLEATNIGEARRAGDDSRVNIPGAIVSAAFPNLFYIETDIRDCGICVEKSAHGLAVGMRANVAGVMRTNPDGERYIEAETAVQNGSGTVNPLGVSIRTLGGGDALYNPITGAGQRGVTGGSGLPNIGLLVRIFGRVTDVIPGAFYVDDGSGMPTDAGHQGVRVSVGSAQLPAELQTGVFAAVVGVSSCARLGDGSIIRVLKMRDDDASDIVVIGYPTQNPVETDVRRARFMSEDTLVKVQDGVVTAGFNGFFYIECEDQTAGIRVDSADQVSRGDKPTVIGRLATSGGERSITSASITANLRDNPVPPPVGMPGDRLGGGPVGALAPGVVGGTGLTNIGLLVRTFGRIAQIQPAPPAVPDWFMIDDGSVADVKCLLPTGVTVDPSWDYVGVTGISSCETVGLELHRLVRVREQSDIVLIR
ncbi:MAG: NosD domain-containing protein, partial [Armatimonadota bacterium]|nr:NosD domain-containing protein [Armatimonadota bacterium]